MSKQNPESLGTVNHCPDARRATAGRTGASPRDRDTARPRPIAAAPHSWTSARPAQWSSHRTAPLTSPDIGRQTISPPCEGGARGGGLGATYYRTNKRRGGGLGATYYRADKRKGGGLGATYRRVVRRTGVGSAQLLTRSSEGESCAPAGSDSIPSANCEDDREGHALARAIN